MAELTSSQRMRRAMQLQEPDHVPCAFMSFTAMRRRVQENMYELAKAELAMGLDSFLFIPSLGRPQRPEHPELRGLPVRFDPRVRTVERRDVVDGQTVLHKEYHTPGGVLTTRVRLMDEDDNWPHGNHIPFIDDFQVSRALQPLIFEPQHLQALQYLLIPPAPQDVAAYQVEVEKARAFVNEHNILLVGGWGVGMDMANWLCGIQDLMLLTIENEPFVAELLEMISIWNRQRMEVVLSAPVDLYIRRAWYEGCDFVTPRFYQRVILPRLKLEADLVHEHGAKFGYICTSGLLPLADFFKEAGIDVLIGIDPVQGTRSHMPSLKTRLGDRICLWGGVSGAVTVELGSEEEVRAAVREALSCLGPAGLILSPVDNITIDAPKTWHNLDIFIDEWRKSW